MPLMPGGLAEGLVHGQEAAVAVDQREADRQHVEQRLQVATIARASRRSSAVEQQEGPGAASPAGVGGHVDRAQRPRGFAFGDEPHLVVLADLDEVARSALPRLSPGPQRALDEQAVGGERSALARRPPRPSRPAGASRSPVTPFEPRRPRSRADRAAAASGKRHSSRSPCARRARLRPGIAPALGRDPGDAAGAVAPGHRLRQLEALRAPRRRRRARAAAIAAEAFAIGGVDDQQRPFAVGQRDRIAAEAERRADAANNRGRRRAARPAAARRRLAQEQRSRPHRHATADGRRAGRCRPSDQQQQAATVRPPPTDQRRREPARPAVERRRIRCEGSSWYSIVCSASRPTRCGRDPPGAR